MKYRSKRIAALFKNLYCEPIVNKQSDFKKHRCNTEFDLEFAIAVQENVDKSHYANHYGENVAENTEHTIDFLI